VLPGERERVVGLVRPGDLIDLQAVTARDGQDPPRDLSVFLSDDAFVLTWPIELFREIVRGCPPAWHRLGRFVSPRVVDLAREEAQVTVIAAGGPDWGHPGDARAFALGTAAWLARDRHVVFVDAGDPDEAAMEPFFEPVRSPDWARGSAMDPEQAAQPIPAHRVRHARTELFRPEQFTSFHGLDVVVPDDARDLVHLVDTLRGLVSAGHVVVYLPYGQQVDVPAVRNNDEAQTWAHRHSLAMHVLDGLRIMPYAVLWLCDSADGWYTLTDEAPQRLIRADRPTPGFVQAARERTRTFMTESPRLEDDDRPGNLVDGIMVVPMTERPFLSEVGQLARQAVDRPRSRLGHACDRATRMINRRTVGVALGGGGTWGASHIAVLRALDQAGMDVDYVSGTSFGALVGGIFAGGGLPALDHFLEQSRIQDWSSRVTEPVGRAVARLPGGRVVRRLLDRLHTERLAFANPVAGALRQGMLGVPRALDHLVEQILREAPDAWATYAPGHPCLRETHVPFFAVASNLTTHRTFVPYHHLLGTAVRAAGSLPPGFPGFWYKGAKMVDGAALANVPVETLRRGGADFIIAVNVVGADEVPREPAHQTPGVGSPLERVTDAVTTAWLTLWKAGTAEAERYADVLVDVRISGVGLAETWRAPEVVDALRHEMMHEDVVGRILERYQRHDPDERGPLRVDLQFRAEV